MEDPMLGTKTATRGLLAVILAAAALIPALPADAQEARWFHVRVEEPGETRVSLNLPLALVEVGLDVADRHAMADRDMQWGRDGNVDLADLRRMWTELQAAGDADFVEIDEGDTQVRISTRGDRVLMRVDEGAATRVRLDIPSLVVDALLGTEGERLNLRAAIQELARSGSQDLLDIQDGETMVRIWIDDSQDGR
jgi:hypothetical protein